MPTDLRSVCGCHPYLGALGCSWWRFVATLPPDDPVRLDTEAGAESLEWADGRWNRGSCSCACHDGDDNAL